MSKLPSVVSAIPQDLKAFVNQVREALDGRNGEKLVTVNDLIRGGLAVPGPSNTVVPPSGAVGTPATPKNVAASAAIRNIIVTWDAPLYNGHSHAEIWTSTTNDLGVAVQVGMSPGAIFVDAVGPSVTRYYWVRFVNVLGVQGAFNAVEGTSATTGSDVAYTVGLLAGQITSTELATSLNSRINLIDGPATTTGTIPNQLALIQGQIDAINAYPDYDNATTYATDDIVKYEGGLYKALSSTTGNLPTNATYWLKIGDYSSLADIVAVHSADISTLNTGLSGEITARETLATQMRGSYSGTDLASVTSGLIFSERTARASADSGLAATISSVSATAASKNKIFRQVTEPTSPSLNDIWVDTKPNYDPDYFSEDYSAGRFKQFQWSGTEWINITDTDITDNFALITVEQLARASADEAFAEQITTLETSVNDPVTGLVATRATLINDYSTTSTVNSAIASSKTALRAYTDVSASRTFRQAAAPTKRGVDADTTLDIPLQTGDVWVDVDDLNKMYQWSGTEWVYSPDGVITGSVTALAATLDTEYLTATDTENAIAQSSTFLRAYADIQSKVFRTADEPTKRGVDPETAADIPLEVGDVWYDTNDSNKLYLWSGSAWVYSPDAVITGSVTAVDARVTTVETTQIGYCTIGGLASDDTNKAACEAAGGTWNVGIPIATAVKQVSVSDGADSATLEQRFTAQKTLNDGLQAQYTIKLDVNGNVAGYGIYADSIGSSEFIANVNRFAVTTPQSSIQVRAISTTYAQGAIARVAGQDSKTLVCKIGGSTGSGSISVGNIGTLIVDGSVTWQVASRVPFAVQAVPTEINGQPVPAGVYIDAAYVLNATIQNAQIADLAVDDNKIASLSADKITAGFISADRIEAGSISAAKLDTSYLTVSASSAFLQDGEAAADINANTTTINGGKITTNTLTVDKISSGTTTFDYGNSFSLGVSGITLNGFTGIEAVKVGANKWGIISFQEAPGSDQCAAIAGSTLSNGAFSVAGFAAFSTAYNSFYTASALANIFYGYSGRYNRSIGTPGNQSITPVNNAFLNGSDNAAYFAYYGNTASSRITEVYLANTTTVSAYVGRRYDTSGTTLLNEMYLNNGSYSAQSTTGAIFSAGGYLPFTGVHDGLIEATETLIVGDIVVDYQVEAVLNPSNVVMLYKKSSAANQKGVIGVCIEIYDTPPSDWNEYETPGKVDPITGNPIPDPTPTPNPMYYPIPVGQKVIHVNALGEGTINVCGEGGDIEIGDLIVTSSTPGKGMKQSDDLVRSCTVAKAREAVSFSSASEVKQIACIYMAG